jgi:hypothetical protein
MDQGTGTARDVWVEAALLFLLSGAVTLKYAATGGNPLFWDEYYHLLAARSWADAGTLAVGDGVYTRAAWFSMIVGWMFRTFGESVFVARLPGAGALTLWVVALFLWVRHVAGRTAAWSASLAFCLSPIVLINAVMVRFYGIAGFLFWIACASAFFAILRGRSLTHRLLLALVALVCLDLSYLASNLSRLFIACLALWLVGVVFLRGEDTPRRRLLLAGGALLAIFAGIWVIRSEWFRVHWAFYRAVPSWAMDRGSDIQWYEGLLKEDYPTFWTLLPVAAILSAVRRPALGTMSAVVFGGGFVFLSLGGAKAERFIFPVLPFFFVLWGIAVAELVPGLRRRISSLLDLLPRQTPSSSVLRLGGHAVLLVALSAVLLLNPGFARVGDVLTGQAGSMDRMPQGAGASPRAWEQVAQILHPVLGEADVVITANSLQTLYHLGDYDFAMRPTVISEVEPPTEFGIDGRTGRPAISTLESLMRVVEGHTHGLVFGEAWRWRHPVEGFTDEVTDYILATMEPIPIPGNLGVRAYRW